MSGIVHLDARLSLAFDLYESCDLAADIGTDHAHLPAALLQRGRCQHMILTDLSESALRNARSGIIRFRLTDRVSFRLGYGLEPLNESCSVISVTGMGGRTIREILLAGRDRLRGASLVLSAHTDIPLIRDAVNQIGYHLDREEPCFAAGRYYLVLRSLPGARPVSPKEIRLGGPLFDSRSGHLVPYLKHRRDVLEKNLYGLLNADQPDLNLISLIRGDIRSYDEFITKGRKSDDCTGSVCDD